MSFKYFVAGFVRDSKGAFIPRNIELAIVTAQHINNGFGRGIKSFRDIKEIEKQIGEHDQSQFSISFYSFLYEDSQKGIPVYEEDSITVLFDY